MGVEGGVGGCYYEPKEQKSATAKILLTLLHSERLKLYTIFAFLSAIGLKLLRGQILSSKNELCLEEYSFQRRKQQVMLKLFLFVQLMENRGKLIHLWLFQTSQKIL